MLVRAIGRQDEVASLLEKAWDDEYYNYFFSPDTFFEKWICPTSEWTSIDYISVDEKQKILGYMSCCIDRVANCCYSFKLLNFQKHVNLIFSKDVIDFYKMLFFKFNAVTTRWTAATNNPAVKIYDKLITRFGAKKSSVIENYYYGREGYSDAFIYTVSRKDFLDHVRNNTILYRG